MKKLISLIIVLALISTFLTGCGVGEFVEKVKDNINIGDILGGVFGDADNNSNQNGEMIYLPTET